MDELQRLVVDKLDLESERDLGKFRLVCKAWRDVADKKRSVYHDYLHKRTEQFVHCKFLCHYRAYPVLIRVCVLLHVRYPEFKGWLHGLRCLIQVRNNFWTDIWVTVSTKNDDWERKLGRAYEVSKRHSMKMFILFETQDLLDQCNSRCHFRQVRCSVSDHGLFDDASCV